MAGSKLAYEEIRRKRLEENKKRMQELNLNKLSRDVQSASAKPSPAKKVKPRVPRSPVELISVRRSSRVKDMPPVSYKEVPLEPLERKRPYSYSRKDLLNRKYASDEARAYAIDRAEKLQSGLESEFPNFVKPMLQSHVTGGFWLGLPVHFCKENLPVEDEPIITLEDENGDEFETKYLPGKTGLSGGWRGFAINHELVDGDALVFQLVSPLKFKVYIIRAYETEEDQINESKENNAKNVDVTPLDISAKRVRAKQEVLHLVQMWKES